MGGFLYFALTCYPRGGGLRPLGSCAAVRSPDHREPGVAVVVWTVEQGAVSVATDSSSSTHGAVPGHRVSLGGTG